MVFGKTHSEAKMAEIPCLSKSFYRTCGPALKPNLINEVNLPFALHVIVLLVLDLLVSEGVEVVSVPVFQVRP